MPEAAIHEYGPALATIREVWGPREGCRANPKPNPKGCKSSSNGEFWRGAEAPLTFHPAERIRIGGGRTGTKEAQLVSRMCASTAARKPGGKRSELRLVRWRKPAAALLDNGWIGNRRKESKARRFCVLGQLDTLLR